MNGLSLFANVGIAETYLEQVGVDIVIANELLPNRARFYEHLYPECNPLEIRLSYFELSRYVNSCYSNCTVSCWIFSSVL